MVIERQDMATKEKFDGRSRPTNKVYEKRWDEIFGKKTKTKVPHLGQLKFVSIEKFSSSSSMSWSPPQINS